MRHDGVMKWTRSATQSVPAARSSVEPMPMFAAPPARETDLRARWVRESGQLQMRWFLAEDAAVPVELPQAG